MPVRTALVHNERINVSLTLCGLQGVQHIGKIGSQVFLNKGAWLQLQGGQVTQQQHPRADAGPENTGRYPCGSGRF